MYSLLARFDMLCMMRCVFLLVLVVRVVCSSYAGLIGVHYETSSCFVCGDRGRLVSACAGVTAAMEMSDRCGSFTGIRSHGGCRNASISSSAFGSVHAGGFGEGYEGAVREGFWTVIIV